MASKKRKLVFKWGGSLDQREFQSTTIHVRFAYEVTPKARKKSFAAFVENDVELMDFDVESLEIAGYLQLCLRMGLPRLRYEGWRLFKGLRVG